MPTPTNPASVPSVVERVAETVLPTRHGSFRLLGYRDGEGTEHLALVRGLDGARVTGTNTSDAVHTSQGSPPLVRVHSECLTGDALGSRRCDCGDQLDAALAAIDLEDEGVLVYLRGHEGRGIGLVAKLQAYALQDRGADTVDANTALGLPVDARRYDLAAGILRDLEIDRIRLLSGNPAKQEALEALGIAVVERHSPAVADRPENAAYLATKRARMRHDPAPSIPAQGTEAGAPAQDPGGTWTTDAGVVGAIHQGLDGLPVPDTDS